MLTSGYMYKSCIFILQSTAARKLLSRNCCQPPQCYIVDIIFISYLFIKVNFHILPKPTAVNVA